MTPFVSVIMPAYNSERYIADAIGSLRSQEGVGVEIIVISDGSTDGTERIVGALATEDARIRLFAEPHRGVSAARNVGLTAAKAPFITFLDSDDLCAPGRLQRQAQYLLANEAVDAVMGDMLWFDIAGSDGYPSPTAHTMRLTAPQLSTVLFRRGVFQKIGLCDETFAFSGDVDLILRLWESRAVLDFDSEIAVYYRRHEANMTKDRHEAARFFVQALHRSLVRRRQSGATQPLPPIFPQR
jgi:glycosyltransferase involved in cell wall biosynthesis